MNTTTTVKGTVFQYKMIVHMCSSIQTHAVILLDSTD